MKRPLAFFLALALSVSLALPAAAATDQRLADVTAKVKAALDLDTSGYSDFYGDLEETPLLSAWYLDWSGDPGSLSISATEEGKILSFHLSSNSSTSSYDSSFPPSFPTGSTQAATAAAQDFLDRVLAEGEQVDLDGALRAPSLGATHYRFSGEILLNGLSAGMSFFLSVRCEDNAVTSFSRDVLDGTLIGGIPSADPAVTAAQAADALGEQVSLRLEYVLPEDGGTRAVLRYLPDIGDTYYVDAATGEVVNLTELFRQFSDGGLKGGGSASNSGSDAASGEAGSFTEAEQAGIAGLEGVLDQQALASRAAAISALGLDAYTLASVRYTADRDPDENGEDTAVTAVLRYTKAVGNAVWRRNVTMDAKAGSLLAVSSSAWLPEGGPERTVGQADAQDAAEAFLAALCPGQFGRAALYASSDALAQDDAVSHAFTFAQQENGYFYAGNTLHVQVDATDGSISYFRPDFDDTVTFDSAEGLLSAEAAMDAWLATFSAQLQYVQVPTAIDLSQPEYAPLADLGLSCLYRLVLGYTLEQEDRCLGIDAKTGRPVPVPQVQTGGLTYDDMDGHWAQAQVEALAQYQIGYTGGSFLPGQALTQLDLVALLASAEGYLYRADEENAADGLYQFAYSIGLLEPSQRDDTASLTRIQVIRFLLDAAGYGPIARLEGVFRTSFADDGEIPADLYGYAALAQGLGLAEGAPGSALLPNAAATRAEAAVLLYNLMLCDAGLRK